MANEDTRALITRRLDELDKEQSWLSKQLGKHPAYINQFLKRGTPADLDLGQKIVVAKALRVSLAELGVKREDVAALVSEFNISESGGREGLAENSSPYDPGDDHFMRLQEGYYFRIMTTDDLLEHPRRIPRGKKLVFQSIGGSDAKIFSRLETEDIVHVRFSSKSNAPYDSMVMMFVKPSFLMTCRRSNNLIINVHDETFPYKVYIKAIMMSAVD